MANAEELERIGLNWFLVSNKGKQMIELLNKTPAVELDLSLQISVCLF